MKLQRSILVCVLFLVGTAWVEADPVTVEDAAVAAEPATSADPPAAEDVFGAQVFGSGGCRVEAQSIPSEFPSFCGGCSQDPCKGAWVDSACGFENGVPKHCRNSMGLLCAVDSGVRCFCRTGQ